MKNEEIKISCDICLDLIPLVNDHVASEESRVCVLAHIAHCETCKAEFDEPSVEYQVNDEKIIKTMKQSFFLLGCGCLVVGALFGISFTWSMSMFYNFMIMPSIGALSLLIFKKKSTLAPIIMFLLTFTWNLLNDGMIYSTLIMAIIHTFLVLLGMLIMKLLAYAFTKRG